MNSYSVLNKQIYRLGKYSLVPIRMDDRHVIRKWRNEQIYHLRQKKPLTEEDQDRYFSEVVQSLFEQDQPKQLLFSLLENDFCIGYGGLVHINWIDRHAEVSFIMDTSLELDYFDFHWRNYLQLLDQVAFEELDLHKLFTYAFDVRRQLYGILESVGFQLDARLKEHCLIDGMYKDVLIHSKFGAFLRLRKITDSDLEQTFEWANNPLVRKYSFNTSPIDFDSHLTWFQENLKKQSCKYFILEIDGDAVGSIRFDIEKEGKAKISYLIAPGSTGKGLGTYILDRGIQLLGKEGKDIYEAYGLVLVQNESSIRIFEKLGFIRSNEDEMTFRFTKKFSKI